MFEEFVNLKEASSAAILEYARRWGMLGIWQDSHSAVEAIMGESADPADPFPRPLPRTADVTRFGFFGWVGGEYVEPADIEYLFAPVIGHRLLFAPGFGVVGHKLGRVDAVGQVWERCLAAAPRPSLAR